MYKIQNLRVKLGLQLFAKIKNDNPHLQEDIKSKKTNAKKLMNALIKEYLKLGEVSDEKRNATAVSVYIKNDLMFIMIQAYHNLVLQEERMNKIINRMIESEPIVSYIKSIKGCDNSTAAILLSEIDIRKATYVSSLYMLSGLDCGPDGKARNKTAAHLVDRIYIDKDGEERIKKSITYNSFLHDKILGTIAPNLVRAKSPGYYETYCNYKHRLDMRPDWKDRTKMHKHRAALRYMARVFMTNLYKEWRTLAGLEVFEPYEKAKLGLDHYRRRFPIIAENDVVNL